MGRNVTSQHCTFCVTHYYSVSRMYLSVCVWETGCVHTSPSLLLNCFLFEVRTIDFCTCEWFFLFSSLIQCSLPFCKSKMLYLLHATALMQLYNPPLCSFVFNLFFVFPIVNVNCCRNFCGDGKTSAKGDFLYFFGQWYGFVGRILEIRF